MHTLKKDIYRFTVVHLVVFSIFLKGCATPGQSVGLGGVFGAGAGAIAGGIADPGKEGEYRTRNVIIGSALGGMVGMITGSVIHESTEKDKQEAFQKGQAAAPKSRSGNMPPLRDPRVEARWVESKIVGSRFVEGHFEYQIVEPAHWEEAQ